MLTLSTVNLIELHTRLLLILEIEIESARLEMSVSVRAEEESEDVTYFCLIFNFCPLIESFNSAQIEGFIC